MTSPVYSHRCDGHEDAKALLSDQLGDELLEVPAGRDIAIKINTCDLRTPETGAVTHPVFLRALVVRLKELYPDRAIYILEADATVVLATEFYQWLGYEKALRDLDVTFVNLTQEPCMEKTIHGRVFRTLPLPEILSRCYFISQAQLKTNVMSTITGCLKNQFVLVPGIDKSRYHPLLDYAIADCNRLRTPDFCIVDGIIGHGGAKGPSFGTPIVSRCVVWARDAVAIDTYCARLMGLSPMWIGHIRVCARDGIGSTQYRVSGDVGEKPIDFEVSAVGLMFNRIAGRIQRGMQARRRRARR